MSTETKRYHFKIDDDPRLAAGAGGAVRYLADAAGFEIRDVANLQDGTVAACLEAFEGLVPPHHSVDVTIFCHSDRLEIELCHFAEGAPAVGLDRIAGFASQMGGAANPANPLQVFDRVQYETRGTSAVTRLTKKFPNPMPNA